MSIRMKQTRAINYENFKFALINSQWNVDSGTSNVNSIALSSPGLIRTIFVVMFVARLDADTADLLVLSGNEVIWRQQVKAADSGSGIFQSDHMGIRLNDGEDLTIQFSDTKVGRISAFGCIV